ncbi:unnamed protein product, partial [Adineta steineri]
MLVHLSNTSSYVCDLNRGPIEPANRMASAPARKTNTLLEQKESLPRQVRTPLKLLAPGEMPMDTTVTTTDINASLQPVWYTEQTIIDDHHAQQEDIASVIQEQQQQEERKTGLARTTLSPIPSESPMITEDIEELPNQPSLMHKSSTFTIESSINIAEPLLNDSEKENLFKENEINQPSDDSFRALEQLLGLGSTGTVRESPKTNHDTLSLTVVTPTDIINTTRRSSRLSYVQKGGSSSLPSSQEIPVMPTIESITSTEPPSFLMENTAMEDEQPSTMNQQTTFDMTDNDTIKDDSNNDDETNFSFELNDFPNNSNNESNVHVQPLPPPAEPMITIRAPTCADVAYRALIKPRTGGRVSQPIKADSPLAKTNKVRSSAPTTRALRSSCRRISSDSASSNSNIQEQPLSTNPECFINDNKLIEIVTLPEEDENEQEKTISVILNTSSSKELEEENNTYASIQSEQIATPLKPIASIQSDRVATPQKPIAPIQSEQIATPAQPIQSEQIATPEPQSIAPMLSREYTYNTPKHRSSQRNRSTLNSFYATPKQTSQQTTIHEEEIDISPITSNSMLQILLTKPTEEVQPKAPQKTSVVPPSPVRTSKRSTMKKQANNSPSIVSKSMLQVLLTQPTNNESNVEQEMSTIETSTPTIINNEATNSSSIVSKSMLGILLTQPTEEVQPQVTRKSSIIPSPVRLSKRITMKQQPSIVSKSMLEVLLTKPTETETSVIQKTSVLPSSTRTSKRNTKKEETMNSSLLGILLTNPVEDEPDVVQNTSIAPSSVEISIRKSRRSSSHPTPRVSINPLHSSTPSASRNKSLQMVSIGEQEQLTTTVPQEINIEFQSEQQNIEIVPLNDTEQNLEQASTMEIGVQTTPSLDVSRRRFNMTPQQITPIVIVDEQREITPLQLKGLTNLQRNVRFQLTPSTDARLAIKEQFEENLRGLKPDIVLNPTPVIPEPKQNKDRTVKPKKKVITSKKKKVTPLKKVESKSKSISKKSRQPGKDKNIQKQEPITKTSNKSPRTKRVSSKAKDTPTITKEKNTRIKTNAIAKRAPPKRTTSKATTKRTIPEISAELITKRAAPKRTITEVPNVKPISTKSKTKKPTSHKQVSSDVKIEPAVIKQATPEVVSEPTVKQTYTKRAISKTKKEPIIVKETNPEVIIEPTSTKRATSKTKNEPSVKRAKTSKPVEVKK